jgi:adenosylhomocysteine nucleosidase
MSDLSLDNDIGTAVLASGDKFIGDIAARDKLAGLFGADLCDMETAAVARVARKHQIPTTVIKTVSDSADSAEYETHKDASINRLQTVVEKVIGRD